MIYRIPVYFTAALLAFFLSAGGTWTQAATLGESTYDRIMTKREIRCGYGIFPPYIVKDANTGILSGPSVDFMNEVGKLLSLKITWAEEVDWGAIPQALQARKVDMMCVPMWATAARGQYVAFTTPLFFTTVEAVARADDHRFDNNLAAINAPNIKISINEGDVSQEIAKADFPLAEQVGKIQMAGEAFLLQDVASKKADVTFSNRSIALDYDHANPGLIRIIPSDMPVRVFANAMGADIHEQALISMLNTAIQQLDLAGTTRKIFKPYADKTLLRLKTSPYEKAAN